jgi:5-methylcytosine-specific restriction endonuclease McrA
VRTCSRCSAAVGRYQRRCAACKRKHRVTASANWPSRRRACRGCGKVRTSARALEYCRTCSTTKVPCPRCSTLFWPWAHGKHARKFCSQACARRPKKVKAPARTCQCEWCGEGFVRQGVGSIRFCSAWCSSRMTNRRKKLRRKGLRLAQAQISMPYIYRRDSGLCGLCGRRVSRRLEAPNPMAPTLDHIVPLSQGGQHVHENVQLAHYGCNSRKGNRACGSQLRLVG